MAENTRFQVRDTVGEGIPQHIPKGTIGGKNYPLLVKKSYKK